MDNQPPPCEYGHWVVDDDGEVVIMELSHMGDDGVEVFDTNMPPENAIALGEALIERARDLL